MGQYELNEGLARAVAKPGEARNPTGKQGTPLARHHSKELRRALLQEFSQPCTVPGYEGLSKWSAMIVGIIDKTQPPEPERWAVHFCKMTIFGRAPFQIDVHQHHAHEFVTAENADELLARADRVREQIREQAGPPPLAGRRPVVDIEPEDTPERDPEPEERPEQPADESERATLAPVEKPPAPPVSDRRPTTTVVQSLDPQTGRERTPVHLDNPYVL